MIRREGKPRSTARRCRGWAAAIGILLACGSATAAEPVPSIATTTLRSADVGEGILAPNRVLASAAEDVLYVATGRGETYPEGFLHQLDARTFAELRPRLEVGRNVSDLVTFGGRLLVLSRGDSTLALIDPVAWKELDRVDIGMRPTAAVAVSQTVAAVGGISTTELVVVSHFRGKLTIERRIPMPGLVADLAASRTDNVLYAAITGVGVVAYDIATWTEIGRAPIAGSLGKGAVVWQGYVVVSNRDGYLHFVDRATFAVTTIDVAESLGISRAGLPLRGIDCTDVLSLGGNRIALLNVRQDSLIYQVDPAGPTATVVARFSNGVFGAHLRKSDRLILAQSGSNRLLDIAIPAVIPGSKRLRADRVDLGTEVRAVTLLAGSKPSVAALDSLGRIHIVGQDPLDDRLLTAGNGLTWSPPLIAGPGDTFGILETDAAGAQRYAFLDRNGPEVFGTAVSMPSVYSATIGNGELSLVSRLSHQMQLVDLATGRSRVEVFEHDRSRLSAPIGQRRWVVFHDTVPDIGWTLLRSDHTSVFYPGGTWVTGALPLSALQVATITFSGTLGLMNVDAVYERRSTTGLWGVTEFEPGADADVWITSENLSLAYRVPLDTLQPVEQLDRYGLLMVGALPGTTELAIATTRTVEIAQVDAPP